MICIVCAFIMVLNTFQISIVILSKPKIMKLRTFLSVLTIIVLLFLNSKLYGQCHGGGGSQNTKDTNSKVQVDAATSSDEIIFYACPMHPEIKSLKPETCSKCGMNLEQKKANIYKSVQQKDSVYYTCSMHPEVKESKSGNCPKCGMELIKKSSNDTSSSGGMKMVNCMHDMDMKQPKEKHPMRIAWIGMGVLMAGMMTTMIVVIAGR